MVAPNERDFAGFRIVRPLELGERASVWEAERVDSGESVAIETLAGDAAKDADVRDWFTEAWEAAAELAHPNVVTVTEVGEQDGVPFAVWTPVTGTTLAWTLEADGALEPEAAADLVTQIGGALEAAHEAGIIHGTLSPSSVVVEERDGAAHAYVSGFGRVEGDRREDLRELGAILETMLGGGASETGGVESGADDEQEPAAEVAVDALRKALDGVVATAGKDGYRTAAELVTAAQAAISWQGETATSGDDGLDGSSRRSPVRGMLKALALIVAVVLLVVVFSDGDDDSTSSDSGIATADATSTATAPDATAPTDEVPTFTPPPIAVPGFPAGVSARESTVYVVTRESGELSAFDQASGERTLGPVDLGGGAEGVTVVDGVVWATLPGSDAVARVPLGSTDPVVETIDVGAAPSSLIGAFGSIWVVDEGSAELSRISLEGGAATSTPLDAQEPRGIAFGLGSLWISDAAGGVLRVDPADPTKQEPFEAGAGARGILVVDDHVWVADSNDGFVTEIDPASGESREIEVGGSPRELAADPTRLWVSNGDGYVSSIELDSEGVQEIDLNGAGGSPQGIAVGTQVWTTTGSGDSLVAVAPGE